MWRACNLTAFTHSSTGPVVYPFASVMRDPILKGYLCETGILLLSVVSLHWWPRRNWSLWPCLRQASSQTVTRPLYRQCDNPTWSHTALLSRFHARCRSSLRLHNRHRGGALWIACSLTTFTHSSILLVQWSIHLLPIMRDLGSIPRGVLMCSRTLLLVLSSYTWMQIKYIDISSEADSMGKKTFSSPGDVPSHWKQICWLNDKEVESNNNESRSWHFGQVATGANINCYSTAFLTHLTGTLCSLQLTLKFEGGGTSAGCRMRKYICSFFYIIHAVVTLVNRRCKGVQHDIFSGFYKDNMLPFLEWFQILYCFTWIWVGESWAGATGGDAAAEGQLTRLTCLLPQVQYRNALPLLTKFVTLVFYLLTIHFKLILVLVLALK